MHTSRATVLGGGFGGLVAARILSDHFDEVRVIERDHYPDSPSPRARVPQGTQLHVLLARGLMILEELFEDLGPTLDAHGVQKSDFGLDLRQTLGDTVMPTFDAGIPMRCAPRPLLEAIILKLVRAIPNVTIHEDTMVKEIMLDDAGIVTGLSLDGQGAPVAEMSTDLVVDSRGRNAPLDKWLEEMGFGTPETTVINAGFSYGTAEFTPAEPRKEGEPIGLFCAPRFPDYPVAGILMHLPNGNVMATLIGAPGHAPSGNIDTFVASFRGLPLPEIHTLLASAKPVGQVSRYKATANRRRLVEKMEKWPGRFVALGDVVCALNPRFGQGMTVAASGALALSEHLKSVGVKGLAADPVGFGKAFQRRLGKIIDVPWMMATSEDSSWLPERKLGLKDRLMAWYFEGLLSLSTRDLDASVRFMRVAQMIDHPVALLHPALSLKVLLTPRGTKPMALPQPA